LRGHSPWPRSQVALAHSSTYLCIKWPKHDAKEEQQDDPQVCGRLCLWERATFLSPPSFPISLRRCCCANSAKKCSSASLIRLQFEAKPAPLSPRIPISFFSPSLSLAPTHVICKSQLFIGPISFVLFSDEISNFERCLRRYREFGGDKKEVCRWNVRIPFGERRGHDISFISGGRRTRRCHSHLSGAPRGARDSLGGLF
jgi:hypothetical protein